IALTDNLAQTKNVVPSCLNYGTRLIRLPVESRDVAFRLHYTINDHVPKNWRETVQIERPSANLNIGVKRHNEMTRSLFTRNAHISNYATDSATVYEHATAFSPNFVELIQAMLVILNVSHLSSLVVVFLERPIRGGSHD